MKFGVIGLGLIGGSIFKGLQKKGYDVIGVSRTLSGVENVFNNIQELAKCNVVFVCTPMNKTLETLKKIETIVNKDTIVTDVCSLKEFIADKDFNFKFIPSHPMAGTEFSGWEHSSEKMFKDASWAVTLKDNTSLEDFAILKNAINDLGAKIILTTPLEHDKAVALISHAPMLIAQALCKNIENEELAQKLASSGFRDTTRLALSNTEMANDMISLNKKNIKEAINCLNKNIDELFTDNYKKEIEKIKEFRQQLYC